MNENRTKKVMENIAITRVQKNERKSWLSVMVVQMGCMICVPSLMTGAILIEAMSFSNAIIASVIGSLIVCVLISIVGFIGCDVGTPTVVVFKAAFGAKGTRIFISLILAVTGIGWFAIQCDECGQAFSNMLSSSFGISVPVWVSIVIWGVIMLLTGVFGFGAMEKLNWVAIPLLVLASISGIFLAINSFGSDGLTNHEVASENGMSMIEGIALVVSLGAFAACASPDFTRYQKSRNQVIVSNSIGIGAVGFGMIMLGAVLTVIAGEYDISAVFITVGLPIIGVIALILATWTTNVGNIYNCGLDLVMLFNAPDNKRGLITACAGIIAIVVTLSGIAGDFVSVLDLLGCLTLPSTGVVIGDYFFCRKGNPKNWKYVKGWRIIAFIATGIGIAVTYIPIGIGMINGLIASMIAMVILEKMEKAIMKKPIEEYRTEYTDEDIDEFYQSN